MAKLQPSIPKEWGFENPRMWHPNALTEAWGIDVVVVVVACNLFFREVGQAEGEQVAEEGHQRRGTP